MAGYDTPDSQVTFEGGSNKPIRFQQERQENRNRMIDVFYEEQSTEEERMITNMNFFNAILPEKDMKTSSLGQNFFSNVVTPTPKIFNMEDTDVPNNHEGCVASIDVCHQNVVHNTADIGVMSFETLSASMTNETAVDLNTTSDGFQLHSMNHHVVKTSDVVFSNDECEPIPSLDWDNIFDFSDTNDFAVGVSDSDIFRLWST